MDVIKAAINIVDFEAGGDKKWGKVIVEGLQKLFSLKLQLIFKIIFTQIKSVTFLVNIEHIIRFISL